MDRTSRTRQRAHARGRDWAPAFLQALEDTHLVCEAARKAGIGRRTAYDRRQRDAAFAEAWDDVIEHSTEILEQIAVRRAAESSDQLLMFLLRARRPEVYSERHRVHHSGQVVPVPPSVVLTPEGAQAAHEFLDRIRETGGEPERNALANVLHKRPAGAGGS